MVNIQRRLYIGYDAGRQTIYIGTYYGHLQVLQLIPLVLSMLSIHRSNITAMTTLLTVILQIGRTGWISQQARGWSPRSHLWLLVLRASFI